MFLKEEEGSVAMASGSNSQRLDGCPTHEYSDWPQRYVMLKF